MSPPIPHPSRRHIFFFFNDTATTEIYTLSLHDALPIYRIAGPDCDAFAGAGGRVLSHQLSLAIVAIARGAVGARARSRRGGNDRQAQRSEEHTSELQSRQYLVCRLLLEKKKKYAVSAHP